MTNITSIFSRLFLALALATGAGAALAVPATYHVAIDTSTLAGNGYLDLQFLGLGNAGDATSVVSNFTGLSSGASLSDGSVTGDLGSSATFTGSAYNYLDQLVQFGGMFGFDVLFDYAATGLPTAFGVSLYDLDFGILAGGEIASFQIVPGGAIAMSTQAAFASVSEVTAAVPEPGQLLLMATGLLLLAATLRRRNR